MDDLKNNIQFGREKAVNSFHRIAGAVSLSLGASGSNTIIKTNLPPYYLITPDGGTIVDESHFEDEYEELGADIAREMTKTASDRSGDGRKTTVVIGDAIVQLGKEYSNMDIKDSLNECIPIIMKSIDDQKKSVTTEEEIRAVSTISSRNAETGKMIAEIYTKLGKDCMIELDNSRTWETYYEEKLGLNFPQAGLASPAFETSPGKAEWESPIIFVTDLPISLEADILPVAEMARKAGKNNLVIACDKIGNGALTFLANNQNAGKFNFMVINAPTIMKEYFFEDFAVATGATLVNAKNGLDLKGVKMEHLGTCDKIISTGGHETLQETRLIGIKDLTDHINLLKQGRMTGILSERLRRLNTKVAVMYMSDQSATDLKYKKDKAQDAINAARLALQDGIVCGGGVCLLNASKELPDTIGGKILKEALREPIKQICINAGLQWEPKSDRIGLIERIATCHAENTNIGLNAKTKEIVDMFDACIIDASQVTKNSVVTAIAIAGTFLSTKVMIANKKVEQSQVGMPYGMPMNM